MLRELPQTLHAVIEAVDIPLLLGSRGWEHEVALLNDHEEEQAIDEAQQVVVELAGAEAAIDRGIVECIVCRVIQESCAKGADGSLDCGAEAVADASAGLD